MKKTLGKTLSLLVCLLALVSLLSISAFAADTVDSGTCGDNLTWTLDSDGLLTISGTGRMYDYELGEMPWHSYQTQVKKVVVEDGVTYIGKLAFYAFHMTEIDMPASVTEVAPDAFFEANYITSVGPVGSGCDYEYAWTKTFPQYAFNQLRGLETVIIAEDIESIPVGTFGACSSLKTVYFNAVAMKDVGVNNMIFSADMYGGNDVTVIVGKNVTRIPGGMFNYMEMDYAGYHNFSEVIFEEGSVCAEIGYYAFAGSNMTEITLPASVKKIDRLAFGGCEKLTKIIFEGSAPSINEIAFNRVTATCYYPAYNSTWTDSRRQNYDGTLTWESYTPNGMEIIRIAGSGRCETAIEAADTLKAKLGVEKFDYMIVANGSNFADALAGSYLAAVKDAPILLYRESANALNTDYILENLAEDGTVYLLGGTGAVPENFENILGDHFADTARSVKRLAGPSRYETNLAILEEARVQPGDEILVATALNFADSLSASATGKPILLVNGRGTGLSTVQADYLAQYGGGTITILGGEGAINPALEEALKEYGQVRRLAGPSRYDTSVEIAKTFFGDVDTVTIACGKNFPDGLSGGPVAYANQAPLILTASGSENIAAAYVASKPVKTGYIMGGTGAVSDVTVGKVFGFQ